MTSLVGSSPSSLLRSGSVSAKELESVRRIDCFGEFVSRSGPGNGRIWVWRWQCIGSNRWKERFIVCRVEEIATSESESSFAFLPSKARSDASASFPEMELGEENIGSRLVDLPRLEREGEIK
jgi:hypothetical protein